MGFLQLSNVNFPGGLVGRSIGLQPPIKCIVAWIGEKNRLDNGPSFQAKLRLYGFLAFAWVLNELRSCWFL